MPGDSVWPTLLTQKRQVSAHAFRAGQDDQVCRRNRLARPDKGQLDLRVQAQRVEIGVVADTRQHRHHHPDPLGRLGALAHINGILGFQVEIHQVGQYPQYRFAGALLQPIQARLQQGDITAKAVDHKALHPRLFALGKQRQGADQMGKHPAFVDIGDQDHRAIHRFGKTHIGNIAGTQVDLRWRAGTLDHHHRISGAEALV